MSPPAEAIRVIDLNIAADHPAFAGHFPAMPVVPGVLLLDRAVRAAAEHYGKPLAGVQIRTAKFHAAVGPGVRLELRLAAEARGGVRFEFKAAGTVVASGSLAFAAP